MDNVTRTSAEALLGPLDDNLFASIKATGANLADIAEAKSITDGSSDITGEGERALSGPTKELLIILGGRRA